MQHHLTKPEDKLSSGVKVAYGAGQAADRLQSGCFSQLANPIFNDLLGIDSRIIGLMLGASRVVDAITDPIMGFISDNTRSRWGRRRPWIVLAALPCSVAFTLIWMFPRGMTTSFYVGWFIVTSVAFLLFQSMFSVPYAALGMELTPDYHERTSVMAFRSVVGKCGGFLISSLYLFITWDGFADIADGMRHLSVYIGLLIMGFMLIPAIFVREHPHNPKLSSTRGRRKLGLWASALHTFKNGPFLILISTTAIMMFGLTMVAHLSYYLTIYYMFDGTRSTEAGTVLAFCGYAAQLGGLVGIPVMTFVSKRIGKRRTLLGGMALAFLGDLSKWICFSPTNPYLSVIPNFALAFVLSSAWTLMSAMLPDIVDYDELKHHERREGMFSGVLGWVSKLGVSIALVIGGFVLNLSGFDPLLGPNQVDRTVTFIRTCYVFIPATAMLVGIGLMYFYPLRESHVYAIRAKLERRRRNMPV